MANPEPAPDDIAARVDEREDLVDRFAETADPAALAELIEHVGGVKVSSVKVTRPRRKGPRAAAG